MKKEIIISKDGSHTLSVPEMNETYHSIHGALTESRHVFIKMGIEQIQQTANPIAIFEVGFGTGLNAMTTLEWLIDSPTKTIQYHSIEAFPVTEEVINKLNYADLFNFENAKKQYQKLHTAKWNQSIEITPNFSLTKIHNKLDDHSIQNDFYDCIYFDAFAPNKQEEMWKKEILKKCFNALKQGGRFVTYCAKGQLKRDLKEIGFEVEMVQGPPGKREMTTAIKV